MELQLACGVSYCNLADLVDDVDPLRAIVMRDKCLVFVPDGADSLLTILKEKFRETTRQEFNVAYEFK